MKGLFSTKKKKRAQKTSQGAEFGIQATHENFLQRVHPEDRDQLKEKMARARELSSNFIHEFRIQREGETRWIQSRGQVISSDDDSSPRVIGIDLDITEQKRLQHELEEAVEERDTLIQEVHHRVKNNLQMIISLIRLQLREMEVSETVASSFKDLENRIYTTALIHEQVYRKASLSNINVRDYLRELAEHVIRSQSSAEEVELVTNLEPIDLSIEKLLPCGLVINELLTNALQHGFEDRNEGRVELEFHRLDDSGYELIVADDGVGWQADSSFEDVQSLGMTLVKNLVRKQLHGSIYMTEKAEGVRFRIVIPGEQE